MTVLEQKVNGAFSVSQSSNPVDHASYAASSDNHNLAQDAKHMVFVIGAIMIAIYGLKVVGRVLKRGEK